MTGSTERLPEAEQSLARAVQIVRDGGVLALPTDTVYGLVCRFDSEIAIRSLYAIKERPPEKALPVLLGDESQLHQVASSPLPALARPLMQRFWPGPLTIVVAARPHLPSILTAGQETVAVRVPHRAFLRELARRVGPLASSSANRSGGSECETADLVLAQLAGRLPLLIDGGATPHGTASTVVAVTGSSADTSEARLLRDGPLRDDLLAWLEQRR